MTPLTEVSFKVRPALGRPWMLWLEISNVREGTTYGTHIHPTAAAELADAIRLARIEMEYMMTNDRNTL